MNTEFTKRLRLKQCDTTKNIVLVRTEDFDKACDIIDLQDERIKEFEKVLRIAANESSIKCSEEPWSVETMSVEQTKQELYKIGNWLCNENNNNFGQGVCERACDIIDQQDNRIIELEAERGMSRMGFVSVEASNRIKELEETLKYVLEETFSEKDNMTWASHIVERIKKALNERIKK